jgi:ABC-type Fe3+ transport system substrate-binding protein
VVEEARLEGFVAVATSSAPGYRIVMEAFKKAYPGVYVMHSQFQSSYRDFLPRLLQELKLDVHSWDVCIMPAPELLHQARSAGGLTPVRSAITHPNVLNDTNWKDGFEAGFNDTENRWVYALARYREAPLWINTQLIQDGEITSLADLLRPRWKGKILGADPRTTASGFLPATAIRIKTGDDRIIRTLYRDQEVRLSVDTLETTAMMMRGEYAIGLGAVDRTTMAELEAQGTRKSLKALPIPELDYLTSGSNCVYLMAEAPHPHAAEVFINWLLSGTASSAYAESIRVNSRRIEVPPIDPDADPVPGVDYIVIDQENMLPQIQTTREIAEAALASG